jgi:PAS domain S-box-containing protein
MREQVLGLEVVLADGTVLPMLRPMLKNNTGYDLKQFFIGAEGTLGVITRVLLRLRPLPQAKATALVALPGFDQALAVLQRMQGRFGNSVAAFELMWDNFVQASVQWQQLQAPLAERHPLLALIDVDGKDEASLREIGDRSWAALERARAEARVAEGERELRRLTDALPVLISHVDAQGRYRFNNRAYEEWFGHPREEIYGRTLSEVLGEAAYEGLRPHVERALAGEAISLEQLVPYRDGGERFIHVDYVPRTGPRGERQGYYALVQDIGEQKRADMYHAGGRCEYVWNVWKNSGRGEALQQLRVFMDSKTQLALETGRLQGVFRENIQYMNKYDEYVTALGGQRAVFQVHNE